MSETQKSDPRLQPAPTTVSIRVWLMVGLAFLATILLVRKYSQTNRAGGMADYSWTMRELNGDSVKLSKYAGKPIFLNVWATWCPPCRTEMPSIAKLASNPNLTDVEFLCVAVDESPGPIQAYVDTNRPPMTILHANGSMPKVFDTGGAIPSTFLIAPDGRIVRVEVGSMDWDQPDVIRLLQSLQRDMQ